MRLDAQRRERGPGRRAQPHLPVQAFRHGLDRLRPADLALGAADLDVLELADVAVEHQFAAEQHSRVVPLLRAVLEDDPVAIDGLDHGPAFGDGPAERLLTIDVLAGLGGGDGDQGVPVVGRGDVDGVHVVAGKDLAEVVVRRAGSGALLLFHLSLCGVSPLLAHVADRHVTHVVPAQEHRPGEAQADGRDLDAIAGGRASVEPQAPCRAPSGEASRRLPVPQPHCRKRRRLVFSPCVMVNSARV